MPRKKKGFKARIKDAIFRFFGLKEKEHPSVEKERTLTPKEGQEAATKGGPGDGHADANIGYAEDARLRSLADLEVGEQPEGCDLYIGFDLGTSSTKVVIGDPISNESFPVALCPEENGVRQFLLPTSYQDSGESCELVNTGLGNRSNFKMRLMEAVSAEGPVPEELKGEFAVYAGLVLQRVITWFGEEKACRDAYGHLEIEWHLSVGFPKKSVNGSLETVYKECLIAASKLAALNEPISVELALRILSPTTNDLAQDKELVESDLIQLWPEIAAQLAGYMRSPYRRVGNIVLIDIGAATVDISTLILHGTTEGQVCSFHFCCVEPLGAYYLYSKRFKVLKAYEDVRILNKGPSEHNPMDIVPDELEDFYIENAEINPEAKEQFYTTSNKFRDCCVNSALAELAQFRKAQRDHHESNAFDPWPNRLPLILSGGGSRLTFYKELFKTKLEEKLIPFTRWDPNIEERKRQNKGLEVTSMPKPIDLQTAEELDDDFDRLSVAHGLAYGVENLPSITISMNAD